MRRIADTSRPRHEQVAIRAREAELKRALVRVLDDIDLTLLVQASSVRATQLESMLGQLEITGLPALEQRENRSNLIEQATSLRLMASLLREAIDERADVEAREGRA